MTIHHALLERRGAIGLIPFMPGGIIKAMLAALVPAAWKWLSRGDDR